jgi:hypothetical protein
VEEGMKRPFLFLIAFILGIVAWDVRRGGREYRRLQVEDNRAEILMRLRKVMKR